MTNAGILLGEGVLLWKTSLPGEGSPVKMGTGGGVVVCCLLVTGKCISRKDLLRELYLLPQ